MKKCFLVMVFWLTAGVAFASDYNYEIKQNEFLAREAEVITKVYDVERPPLIPLDYRMNAKQRAQVGAINDKVWEQYKRELYQKVSRTPELDLALDRAYEKYNSAIEAHIQKLEAAENRQLDEMRDALIVDGFQQNSNKLCVPLSNGLVDCF